MATDHPTPTDGPTPPAQVIAAPQRIVLEQPATYFGRFGKLLLLLLVFAVIYIVALHAQYREYFNPARGPQEKYHSLSKDAQKKVAILDISGAILDADGFVKKQIDRVRDDPDVVAVVLRIDSPGGTVTASDYLYHHLTELRKERELPMVVSMGSLCASGGYYIAMAVGDEEDVVFAEPTTWTGSIGVVIPHYNLAGLLARFDVQDDSIASHPDKLMGSPTRQLTDEERTKERALLQDLVDESFARFKRIVRSGRPTLAADEQALAAASTGQIFSAEQAQKRGLVDRIGFVEDALARAIELAGLSEDNVRCVKYKKAPTALDTLIGAGAADLRRSAGPASDLARLFDLAAPRAYYLWTAAPTLLSARGLRVGGIH